MALKTPKVLTFVVSVILAMVVFHGGHVGALEPDDSWQYYGMLVAYIILVLGCTMRGF
jgi:hypothetical protein